MKDDRFPGDSPHPDSNKKSYLSASRSKGDSDTSPGFRLGRLVKRPVLQEAIASALEHDSLCVICSEYGMGAHSAASLVAASYDASHVSVSWVRLNVTSEAVICRRINKAVSKFVESSSGLGLGPSGLLVIDGLELRDDNYVTRASKYIAGAMLAGVHVLVLISPDYRHIVDELPPCRVIGARELLLSGSEIRKWCGRKRSHSVDYIRSQTHAIPLLVDIVRAGPILNIHDPSSREWDERVSTLYAATLRTTVISEEWLFRYAMLAFGSGHINDLRACGIRVSSDLLNELAANCPIFGIDSSTGRFDCVVLGERALLEALDFGRFSPVFAELGSRVLPEIVAILMNQGKYQRAGLLAPLCCESAAVHSQVLAHPLDLIDAGYLGLVVGVAKQSEQDQAMAARKILELLGVAGIRGPSLEMSDGSSTPACLTRIAAQIKLLTICQEAQCDGSLLDASASLAELEPEVMKLDDALTSKLYYHVRALVLALRGAELEAFRELVLIQDLREQREGAPSLFSAVLCRDYELLGKIVGNLETQRDAASFRAAEKVLGSMGLVGIEEQSRAMCELAGLVAGERREIDNPNRVLTRWKGAKKSRVVMWASALMSLGDSLQGQFQRAHVRALEAQRIADELGEADATLLSRMASRCALHGLGESSEWADDEVRGASADLTALERLHGLLSAGSESQLDDAILEMKGIPPRSGVMAIASLVAAADRAFGPRLATCLPLSWRGHANPRPLASAGLVRHERAPARADQCAAKLRVNVLGGVSAWRDGVRIPERDWTRRQAKMLLALLALAPGHLVQRHEAIGLLWPDSDLARGRENLYTVLSSLRSTLGQTSAGNRFVLGELGQIWLDEELVSCDVDEFEEIARRIISRRAEDDEAVALCVALEGMYDGGSFVPADDSVGRFRDRHEELARRYRDAMLVGAEAATRLRDARQAAWFAQSAKRIG